MTQYGQNRKLFKHRYWAQETWQLDVAQSWNILHKIKCPRLENPGTLIRGRAESSSTTWQSCQQGVRNLTRPHPPHTPTPNPTPPLLLWWMSRVGQLPWAHAGITSIITPEPIVSPECWLPRNCWHVSSCRVQSSLGVEIITCMTMCTISVFGAARTRHIISCQVSKEDVKGISNFYHTRRKKCAVSTRFSLLFIYALFYSFDFFAASCCGVSHNQGTCHCARQGRELRLHI